MSSRLIRDIYVGLHPINAMAVGPTVFVWFEVELSLISEQMASTEIREHTCFCFGTLKCVPSRIHVSLNPNVTSGLPTLCALFPVEVR